jgi:hypothetical protein
VEPSPRILIEFCRGFPQDSKAMFEISDDRFNLYISSGCALSSFHLLQLYVILTFEQQSLNNLRESNQ